MKMKIYHGFLAVLAILLLMSASIMAQTTANTIIYQGRLTNADGTPIAAATSVLFKIWSGPGGGTVLYDTTAVIVPDGNGVFTIELGPLSAAILDGTKRSITLNVEGDGDMLPPQVLTSSPAAHSVLTSAGTAYNASLPGNTFRALSDTSRVLDSVTILAPEAGYALIMASTTFRINHVAGNNDEFYLQISALRDAIVYSDFGFAAISYSSAIPAGTFFNPVCVQRIFPVARGSNTFYVNAECIYGYDASDRFIDLDITAVYIPKGLGTVSNPAAAYNPDEQTDAKLGEKGE